MSRCAEIRDLMLEAEPGELRGEGGTTVADHVRGCPACARIAAVLLDETAALAEVLGGSPSPGTVDAVVARATGTTPATGVRPLPFMRRHRWWGLAAAAAAAGVLLLSREGAQLRDTTVPPARVAQVPPVVSPEADQDVAVFQTDNPDITVLWFF